jgi:hypothetical protein
LNVPLRRFGRGVATCALLAGAATSCVPLGMTLPFDTAQPEPEGRRIKPSLGWLTTAKAETATSGPDGSIAIEVVHIGGRAMVQQVRRYSLGNAPYADSILLDRSTLRPVETWRWTALGAYVVRYHRRSVERVFQPRRGPAQRSVETMDVEPYSALGMELLIAALPLGDGYHGMLPVVVDTASRGWSWLRFEVQRELTVQERPDQPERSVWIVNCDLGRERTRLYVAMDGRSVRLIERLGPDNEVLGVLRRFLLRAPEAAKHAE